ncbi:MAG: radical SAM family heme chaperone HemW [Crocinitomicaceae bacterium]|nr:radical SAM family heme chaperone HemW [Crocinitomicaceae bacterium]
MAGIYIHIPYCKVKCHYCDFHFSTQTDSVSEMIRAICSEIEIRKSYLQSQKIETIYFGGGTPGFIPEKFLKEILDKIYNSFAVDADAEITVECNPDDITEDRVKAFAEMGVNRFSLGVQSFDNDVLKFMNRAHDADQIYHAVEIAKKADFQNITLDLIYGIPEKDLNYWKRQLNEFYNLELPHLSSYSLTIEPKTFFGAQQKTGKLFSKADELVLKEFQFLMDSSRDNGFEQYEISNFAKPGYISRHNSSYWLGKHYLGIGPSAHSYNGSDRGWNVSNNAVYIRSIKEHSEFHTREKLTTENKCNDYLLTRLRTKWGIDLDDLNFIEEKRQNILKRKTENYCREGLLINSGTALVLSDIGKYQADGIAADLFI